MKNARHPCPACEYPMVRSCRRCASPRRGTSKPSLNKGEGRYHVWIDGKPVRHYRHVMEQALGRPLRPDEVVHHINGDKADDRLENLEIMALAEHTSLHHKGVPKPQLPPDRWSHEHEACRHCDGTERRHHGRGLCERCYLRWRLGKPAVVTRPREDDLEDAA